MKENKIYTTTIDEDGVLTFPEELIESLGWHEGDELRYFLNQDKSVTLINITATLRNEKFSTSTGHSDQRSSSSPTQS